MNSKIKIGDKIPSIALKNQNDELVQLDELAQKGPLVVYFYPKDETPGCTAQACGFRDSHADFMDVGAQVVGISGDSPASHQKFAKRHNLQFDLLSDSEKLAEKAFGVPKTLFGLLPGRVTYVFDNQGLLIKEFNSSTMISKHIKEAIGALNSTQS
ncbi:MAG: peroxiredoxin [Cyclobacteriaceae bacterium]